MGRVCVGESDGDRVYLNKEARETHLHIIGSTGSGKSKLIERMIREDILRGHGVCFIDPHGSTYDNLVAWLEQGKLHRHRQIHLIDPSNETYAVGFNPLATPGVHPIRRVQAMTRACQKVWGEDFTATPRLARMLRNIFYSLAVNKLSILEADILTSLVEADAREALTADLPSSVFRREWDDVNFGYADPRRPQLFIEAMDSVKSRLQPFLASPVIERMMGQTENTINWRDVMDEGHIVLVNLSTGGRSEQNAMTEETAQLLGALLFSDLFLSATSREERMAQRRPFYCYVDECADYLTDDIARILDQTRKFGLHLTLAHQRLRQLGPPDGDLYNGVMESARSKIVFNIEGEDSAEVLASHLFRLSFDVDRRKEGLTNPVATGSEVVTLVGGGEGHSDTEVETTTWGETMNESSAVGGSHLEQYNLDGEVLGSAIGNTNASAAGSGSQHGGARSRVISTSSQSSWQQSLRTIYEERGEPMSLEEQLHEAIAAIRGLPDRHCLAYVRGQRFPQTLRTLTVRNTRAYPERVRHFRKKSSEKSRCTAETAVVDRLIRERKERILGRPEDIEFSPVDDHDVPPDPFLSPDP